MNWFEFLEKSIWFGSAAVGFAILFNVPIRTLKVIIVLGAVGGLIKTALLLADINVVLASLGGSISIGFLSVYAAHILHTPPMIFAIPSVIPMVPGVFAYRMMIGLMKLSSNLPDDTYSQILSDTVNNGIKAIFILLSLALGVAIPFLITRKDTIKVGKRKYQE